MWERARGTGGTVPEARELFVVVAVTGAPAGGPARSRRRPLERKLRSCELYGRRQAKWLLKSVRGDGGDQVLAIADDGTTEPLFRAPAYQRGHRLRGVARRPAPRTRRGGHRRPHKIDLAPLSSPGARARAGYADTSDSRSSPSPRRQIRSVHACRPAAGSREGRSSLATIDGQDVVEELPGRASRRASFRMRCRALAPTP